MRRFVMALALAAVFVVPTKGGEIPSTDFVPPPPPSPAMTDGDMGAGGFAQEITDEVVLAIFGMFTG